MSKLDDDIVKNDDDMLVFNPYNPNNKEITKNIIEAILKKYGINKSITNTYPSWKG